MRVLAVWYRVIDTQHWEQENSGVQRNSSMNENEIYAIWQPRFIATQERGCD